MTRVPELQTLKEIDFAFDLERLSLVPRCFHHKEIEDGLDLPP